MSFPAGRVWWCWAAFALTVTGALGADAAKPAEGPDDDSEDVTKLAAYNVSADRVETFGFRIWWHLGNVMGSVTPFVSAVYPNTAAAKAGLRPGDRILTTDGASAAITLFSLSKWRKLQERKDREVASGKKTVTWVLEVAPPDGQAKRTVRMSIPTPPPHWGATKWQPPEGRVPAVVAEAGPLAALAREVMDHGIWVERNQRFPTALGLDRREQRTLPGFEWTLVESAGGVRHRVFVTQHHGRTEIAFERGTGWNEPFHMFLTSPSGALEKALRGGRDEDTKDAPLEEGRGIFQGELDFWLKDVGRVTGRWPFEILKTASLRTQADGTTAAPVAVGKAGIPMGQRAESFVKLTPATGAQKALFAEALGKLGADEGNWAYTETSRGLEDKRVTVVRVDPSKPDAERCMLLQLDGKAPTAEQVKAWRFEGRDVSPALGDLPPIHGLVDTDDVRVFADEVASIVFELPLRGGNAQFPVEKFQALFRVNKTQRAFEDFRVKLRESFRVAGVVSVTDAGMEARFQTLDPAHPPQPVLLKAGGGVRVLLVKFSRSFESTRTDFRRVEPYAEK